MQDWVGSVGDKPTGGSNAVAKDIIIGVAASAATLAARLLIDQLMDGIVQFSLIFPALAIATLLSSWRAGLIVIVICQIGVWYLFMPPVRSFEIQSAVQVVNLLLATTAQLILLAVLSAYQRSRAKALELEAMRRADLEVALDELDHRTMNNFQLAIAILRSQVTRGKKLGVEESLNIAIGRLHVLAAAHGRLKHRPAGISSRPLAPLIDDILATARAHAADLGGVIIETALDNIEVPPEHALRVGLIVNELVTNALKHAFPDDKGHISIELRLDGNGYRLRVADDGVGRPVKPSDGTGSRLLPMLAKSIGAEIVHLPGPGTVCELQVPVILWPRLATGHEDRASL